MQILKTEMKKTLYEKLYIDVRYMFPFIKTFILSRFFYKKRKITEALRFDIESKYFYWKMRGHVFFPRDFENNG